MLSRSGVSAKYNALEFDINVLKEAIYQSHFITNHLDFYNWQQEHVCKFIPHNVLIAGWGNFAQGRLSFDISSNIPEIHRQQLSKGCNEIRPLMLSLFNQWEDNDDKWFLNKEFNISEIIKKCSPSDKILSALSAMNSVLVYGFRDKRSDTDVLYVFLNLCARLETHTELLSTIMPHLDESLRRVECLPKNKQSILELSTMMNLISERESDVLNLVVQGKTNIEIATSLYISINTVKNHLKSIFKKMDVSSRAEAVAKYLSKSYPEKSISNDSNHEPQISVNRKQN